MRIIERKGYRYEIALVAMMLFVCSLTGCGLNSGGNTSDTKAGDTTTGQAIKLSDSKTDFVSSIHTTEAYSCCNDTFVFLMGSSEEAWEEAAKEKLDLEDLEQDVFCQYTLSGELVHTYPIPVDPEDYCVVEIVNVTNAGMYFTIEEKLYFAPISDEMLDLSAGECIYTCEDIENHFYDYMYCDERYICYNDMDETYHEYDRQTGKLLAISADQADYLVPYDSLGNALVTEGTLALMKMDDGKAPATGLYIHQIGTGKTTLLEEDVEYNPKEPNPQVYAANGRIVYVIYDGYEDDDVRTFDIYCYDVASGKKEKLMSMPESLPEMNQYQDSIGFSMDEADWDDRPPYFNYTLMGDRLYMFVPGHVATATEGNYDAVFHIDLHLAAKKLVYDKKITEFTRDLVLDSEDTVSDLTMVYDQCYITTSWETYCYDLTTDETIRIEDSEDYYSGEINPKEFYFHWIYN